jgi:hypothetical protein
VPGLDYPCFIIIVAEQLAEAPRGWKVVSLQPGHTKTLNWDSLPVRGLRHIRTWSEIMCISPSNWSCTVQAVRELKHRRIRDLGSVFGFTTYDAWYGSPSVNRSYIETGLAFRSFRPRARVRAEVWDHIILFYYNIKNL